MSSLETRTCYVMQIINTNNIIAALNGTAPSNESSLNKDTSSSSITSLSCNAVSRADAGASVTSNVLVYIKSISEFPLSSGILSFSIVDAAVRRQKCANDNYMCEELDDYDEETSSFYCVVVHMYIVQSKSMQECHIIYQPTVQENAEIKSTMSSDSSGQIREHNSIVNNPCSENDQIDNMNDHKDDENKRDDRDNVILTPMTKEDSTSNEKNALELLLGITNATSTNSHVGLVSNSGGSNVVSVAAAAAAAPSVMATENNTDSRNPSPKASGNVGIKTYPQVNLMTPDAFTSSTSTNGK